MFRIGQEEIDAVAKVIRSGKPFRYREDGECDRFERRYAEYLGVGHCRMAASGTMALTAALVGLGIGPGDEVLVPACTYMATPAAVLSAGAIPVVVDVDESLTIDPEAVEAAIQPATRAVVPVHMWGLPCAMDRLMNVADRHDLVVVEDACQGVGGGYRGRKLGSIGRAGAFSFNYYKNMTCGEGGAVVTDDEEAARRAGCAIDCCNFYWTGREDGVRPFIANGARASEFEGALLNVQLDRIDGIIAALREQKARVLEGVADTALEPVRSHSPEHECATHLMFRLPGPDQADRFAELAGGTVCARTGRHVYTEWDPVLAHRGAHHPAMNPYRLPQNEPCRTDYSQDMCARSLDILNRTVFLTTEPGRTEDEMEELVETIRSAAGVVLGESS